VMRYDQSDALRTVARIYVRKSACWCIVLGPGLQRGGKRA
jgi:hypothetical protein